MNGDKRSARSFRKLSTYSGRQRSLSMTNMALSCSRVSLPACLQPKVSTQTRFPPSQGALARAQTSPRARGKNPADHPRHCVPMDLVPGSCRRRAYPSRPPYSNSYLLIVTRADTRHPRPTLAWGSTHPTLIRVLRCQWIRNFWTRYSSCRILFGRTRQCQVSLFFPLTSPPSGSSSAVLYVFITAVD